MNQGRLQKAFDGMAQAAFGNVSVTQYNDMRRCFMAGAASLLALQLTQLSPGDGVTTEDLGMMGDLQRELLEFNHDVRRGIK